MRARKRLHPDPFQSPAAEGKPLAGRAVLGGVPVNKACEIGQRVLNGQELEVVRVDIIVGQTLAVATKEGDYGNSA